MMKASTVGFVLSILCLGACTTAPIPSSGATPRATAAVSNDHAIGTLTPRKLAAGECGMFLWAKTAERNLVFFNTRGAPNSHVGIYLGDGRFVHAPRARTLVRIDQLDDVGYRGRFTGARRIDPLTFVVATVDPAG